MRKIETRADREKKKRKNQIVVGVILVAIMVLSTAGYSIMDRDKTEESKEIYNNFEFASVAGRWEVQKQSFNLVTRYLPNEVENVSYKAAIPYYAFADAEVYFVAFSDDAKMVANEIATNLPALRAQLACLEQDINKTECSDLPLKTCSSPIFIIDEKILNNTSSSVNNTANFNKSIEPKIYQKENCITIESSSKDMMRAADRFLFGAYGII